MTDAPTTTASASAADSSTGTNAGAVGGVSLDAAMEALRAAGIPVGAAVDADGDGKGDRLPVTGYDGKTRKRAVHYVRGVPGKGIIIEDVPVPKDPKAEAKLALKLDYLFNGEPWWLRLVKYFGLTSASFGVFLAGMACGAAVWGVTVNRLEVTTPPAPPPAPVAKPLVTEAELINLKVAASLHKEYLEDQESFDALLPDMRRDSADVARACGLDVVPVEPVNDRRRR